MGFSVVCSDEKAMREPLLAEQQDCSPAFIVYMWRSIQDHGIIYKVYYRVWQDTGLAQQRLQNALTTKIK